MRFLRILYLFELRQTLNNMTSIIKYKGAEITTNTRLSHVTAKLPFETMKLVNGTYQMCMDYTLITGTLKYVKAKINYLTK